MYKKGQGVGMFKTVQRAFPIVPRITVLENEQERHDLEDKAVWSMRRADLCAFGIVTHLQRKNECGSFNKRERGGISQPGI